MQHHATTTSDPGSRLVARVPADVRADLGEVLTMLARLTPLVVATLRRVHPLTGAAEEAMAWPADLSPAELAPNTDEEWSAALEALGVHELWALADQLAAAHPDRCEECC